MARNARFSPCCAITRLTVAATCSFDTSLSQILTGFWLGTTPAKKHRSPPPFVAWPLRCISPALRPLPIPTPYPAHLVSSNLQWMAR